MKFSELFTRTRKQAPADEVAKNAQLLIRAGYIHKEMAGVYAYLPLGLRVIDNIKAIVREEMRALGAQELIMTNLQSRETWEITDRWDEKKVDVWFKSKLQNDIEVGLAWSHEEPITLMVKEHLKSYRDLPVNVYQFQTKLRNELRAKSGIMRTREFVMKDLYSYSRTDEEHQKFYDVVSDAYLRIFDTVGLGDRTFLTFASGGAFTQFSHEFQTLTEAGEDTIYLDRKKKIAINDEVYRDDVIEQLDLKKDDLEKCTAAEVGNIFSFGTTKSEQLGLTYSDENGQLQYAVLGSYGIGIGRLMGVIVETFADEKGIVWPENVAPFKVQLVSIGEDVAVRKSAEEIYAQLQKAGIAVLYDDRAESAGSKLADADLMGMPYRVVVSAKTLDKQEFELTERKSGKTTFVSSADLIRKLA